MRPGDPHAQRRSSRVVIADDHPLFRSALRHILQAHSDIEVVGEAADGRQALELCRSLTPELVLMDLGMPEMDGIAATRAIKKELPGTLVLVLTALDRPGDLSDSLKAGAAGYVLKHASPAQITDAVRKALAGESALNEDLAMRLLVRLMGGGGEKEKGESTGSDSERPHGKSMGSRLGSLLTPREVEVLRLVVRGHTNQQIARNLSISTSTVKRHIRHIGAKLGVRDRVQAAVRAVELGVLDESDGG